MKLPSPGLSLIAGLVWWGAVLSLAGWVLSFFRALTPSSYGLLLAILTGITFWFLKDLPWSVFFRRTLKRLRQPLPAVFAAASCLVAVGALFYPPSNYDALTYRIPRIMHWLSQEGWFWIATANPRQNYSGVGQEWLLAPVLALTRTDRLLFLPNFVCFIFLPSVFFRLFRGIGCSRRMASMGMWVFPFAPVYLLQAGGMANDLLGSFWFLASLALLPGRTLDREFAGSSILSVALSTAVKASNLVLLLPWVVKFIWESLRVRKLWRPALVTAPLAFLVSFAPIACLNIHHTGDWSGDPWNEGAMKARQPLPTAVGNGSLVVAVNLQQPIGLGTQWFFGSLGRLVPQGIKEAVLDAYPRWTLPGDEFAIEENAAWGWPIVLLLILSAVAGAFSVKNISGYLCLAGWISAVVMMAKLASEAMPRLLSPLYPLLLLPLGMGPVKPSSLFRRAVFCALGLMLLPLILAPSRPLLPWSQISRWIESITPSSKWPDRITQVTGAYRERAQGLQPLIPLRVGDKFLQVLLISNGNDTEGPLWFPYGKRRVESRQPTDQPPLCQPDLILIREKDWPAWSSQWGIEAQPMGRISLVLLARVGPEDWLCMQPDTWPDKW